jgi:hypothetical protein
MTVREGEANSHQNKGWETFTDAVIEQLASKSDIVYLLWGNPAQSKYVYHAASPTLILSSAIGSISITYHEVACVALILSIIPTDARESMPRGTT